MSVEPVVITLKGFDASAATEFVAKRIQETLYAHVQERIDAKLDELVSAALEATISQNVSAAVQEYLDKGFSRTNEWGSPINGQRVSLSERISYRSSDSITGMAREMIEKAVKAEMDGYGKTRVREVIDATINAKLADTLKQGLGLK
jgi:tRNA A37 N6-isopentenylltransferase MiaA